MNEDDVAQESSHVDDEVKLIKCDLKLKWAETIETVVNRGYIKMNIDRHLTVTISSSLC